MNHHASVLGNKTDTNPPKEVPYPFHLSQSCRLHRDLPTQAMDPSGGEIAVEVLSFIRTYKDGRVERLLPTDFVPPSLDPTTGVTSKDVMIDHETNVSARLYLPDLASLDTSQKLPILVYVHGGGFCIGSPFGTPYHSHLNSLVAKANVVSVSVDYRLAPENPIPAAYEDLSRALQWVVSHSEGAGPEPWVAEHGDLSRVFLAGDSAGANIVHNVVMRAKARIEGVVLVDPFFWGSDRMGCEKDRDDKPFLDPVTNDLMWKLACPGAAGSDDPRLNPMAKGAPSLAGLGCGRVLVVVAERDVLRDRGRAYYEALKGSGWGGMVELFETKGEDHVFHLFEPGCEKALELLQRFAGFIKGEQFRVLPLG